MKKVLSLAVAVLLLTGVANATNINLSGSETSLQLILDQATVGGHSSINVLTDQLSKDAIWTFSNSTIGSTQLIIEIAGMANQNVFGIYDPKDLSKKVVLFTGSAGDGAKASFTLADDFSIEVTQNYNGVFVQTGITFTNPTEFGFYLQTPNDTFYSGDLFDRMVAYQGVGDDMTIKNVTRTVNSGAYILAWEDLYRGSDNDFNDMVLIVESVAPVPEPATMMLLGAGLLGLAGLGRKKLF